MMKIVTRIGPWIFVATLAWYLTGNYLINQLDEASLKRAKTAHQNVQQVDLQGVHSVAIRMSGEGTYYRSINIELDPTLAQAEIINNNINLMVSSSMIDGNLDISFERINSRHQRVGDHDVTLRLPASIDALKILGGINADIYGQLLEEYHEFGIEVLDCESTVILHKLSIDQLKLTVDVTPQKENYCNPEFRFTDDINIKKLLVNMNVGQLNYYPLNAPNEILLTLGGSVIINATVPFIRAATFSD